MSPTTISLLVGIFLGASGMGLVWALRHLGRPEDPPPLDLEEAARLLSGDQRFHAGYLYGLRIGHESGWRDCEMGRVM